MESYVAINLPLASWVRLRPAVQVSLPSRSAVTGQCLFLLSCSWWQGTSWVYGCHVRNSVLSPAWCPQPSSSAPCFVCSAEQGQNTKLMNSTLQRICAQWTHWGARSDFYSFPIRPAFVWLNWGWNHPNYLWAACRFIHQMGIPTICCYLTPTWGNFCVGAALHLKAVFICQPLSSFACFQHIVVCSDFARLCYLALETILVFFSLDKSHWNCSWLAEGFQATLGLAFQERVVP